jgi:hypothetical protein
VQWGRQDYQCLWRSVGDSSKTFCKNEPYVPTIARAVPTVLWTLEKLLGYERFSKRSKDRLHQTQHPNALPASWRCPGQPRNRMGSFFILFVPDRLRSWMRLSQPCRFQRRLIWAAVSNFAATDERFVGQWGGHPELCFGCLCGPRGS